jgi:nicotinamidase-related amidase
VLRNLGVEHVILAGVSYDGGLESSIRSATDRGYGLVLVPDACASFTETQQRGLWHMESGIIQVKPLSAIIDQIHDLPASSGGEG